MEGTSEAAQIRLEDGPDSPIFAALLNPSSSSPMRERFLDIVGGSGGLETVNEGTKKGTRENGEGRKINGDARRAL